jgi:hypothetical protein
VSAGMVALAHNAANVSVMCNSTEWLGLSVCWDGGTGDACELDVHVLSLCLDCEVLNIYVPRTFSRSTRVYHVDGSLVISIQ